MPKPAKGKAKVKVTSSGKRVSYGQSGPAKGGGPRVKPGTSKGDSYCKRNRTILILQTIFQEVAGNARALKAPNDDNKGLKL